MAISTIYTGPDLAPRQDEAGPHLTFQTPRQDGAGGPPHPGCGKEGAPASPRVRQGGGRPRRGFGNNNEVVHPLLALHPSKLVDISEDKKKGLTSKIEFFFEQVQDCGRV